MRRWSVIRILLFAAERAWCASYSLETGNRIAETGCNGHEVTARLSKIYRASRRRTRSKVPGAPPRDNRLWANAFRPTARKAFWSDRRSRWGKAAITFMGCEDDGESRKSWQANILVSRYRTSRSRGRIEQIGSCPGESRSVWWEPCPVSSLPPRSPKQGDY